MGHFLSEGRPFAVAMVWQTQGSTPLPAGARALIEPDGRIHGTVGGGAVEAATIRCAREALKTGLPAVLDFDLHGPGPGEPSPICGGRMRLLVDPTPVAFLDNLIEALAALNERKRGWWITQLRGGPPWRVQICYWTEDEVPDFPNAPPAEQRQACLAASSPIHIPPLPGQCSESLMEPLAPPPRLVMVGGGHVGQAVATQAALLGFEILVLEDRPEFAMPELFPRGTQIFCGDIVGRLGESPTDSDTFIVLATRGHQKDAEALRACIKSRAGYLGMIGSRRKVALMKQTFLECGWATEAEWERLYAPIGLDIGAVTAQEIATAILAQIIAVRRKGTAPRIPLATSPA